jgi:hypothetical protein
VWQLGPSSRRVALEGLDSSSVVSLSNKETSCAATERYMQAKAEGIFYPAIRVSAISMARRPIADTLWGPKAIKTKMTFARSGA